MSYIFKRSIKSPIYFILFSGVLFSDSRDILDSLSAKISVSHSITFECDVVQYLGDDIWQDKITIRSYGPKRFEVKASDQVVRIENDTVWTCLMATKQVTIDKYFSDAPNIFHFLTGNLDDLEILNTKEDSKIISISFYDKITGYNGQLMVDPDTYYPEKLIVELDNTSEIEITILELTIGGNEQPDFFQWDDSWSLIDLRE